MATVVEGATQFIDLPLAPEETPWDGDAARKRLAKWASSDGSGDKETIDWPKYRKGFFWYDEREPENFGSYKLPFADVIDGQAMAVWNGVRAALQRLPNTDIPEEDKVAVRRHIARYYRKFGREMPEESAELSPEGAVAAAERRNTLEAWEAVLLEAAAARDQDRWSQAKERARREIERLTCEGREELLDTFGGVCRLTEAGGGRTLKLKAIVAQVDTVNRNNRLYPKEEMAEALVRANRACQRGEVLGLADHPGLWGSGVRDVVVKWKALTLVGDDIIAEGEVIATQAGQDIAKVLESGAQLQWSLRGWGKLEPAYDDRGQFSHEVVRDYILRGIDCVVEGASDSSTLSVTLEHRQEVAMSKEDIQAPEPEPVREPAAEAQERVAQDIIDEVRRAAASTVAEALEAAKLQDFKAKALSEVTDEELRRPLERALSRASTMEEARAVYEEMKPLLEKALRPEPSYAGIGIITEQRHQRQKEELWVLGGEVRERPDTAEQVRRELVESYPDNGKFGFDNPRNVFEALVDTMFAGDEYKYFYWATKEGVRRLTMEASTTTAAMGTSPAMVLPMMRSLYPKLIPFEIASVQPLTRPTGTIYFLSILKADTNEDLADSSAFDSTWEDHTEGDTKAQIKPSITSMTVTARTKAIQYDVTEELRQDMRAVHGLDLDALMIEAATNQIARSINFSFLELIRAGATAGNLTYGTQVPSGSGYTLQQWNNRLGAFITRAQGLVSEKVYNVPDWVVCGPGAAGVLKAMNAGGVVLGDTVQFGSGLTYIGVLGGTIRVYEAAWFTRNVALFGFKPPTWDETGAVYAPYVALFISPEDYNAAKNTYSRSVSSRYAMRVTNGDCFSTITIVNAQGTDITSW